MSKLRTCRQFYESNVAGARRKSSDLSQAWHIFQMFSSFRGTSNSLYLVFLGFGFLYPLQFHHHNLGNRSTTPSLKPLVLDLSVLCGETAFDSVVQQRGGIMDSILVLYHPTQASLNLGMGREKSLSLLK